MSCRASGPAQIGIVAQHMFGHLRRQMNKDFDQLAARAAPVLFVVLWSTGFVATKYMLRSAEPLTSLTIRTAVAVSLSIPAGLSALIPGLQPILTSTLANRWLGERVAPLQWGGLLLGLTGVAVILHERPMSGEAGWGWLSSGVSLVSITLGTLYQRRYCRDIDWRAGNLVQYVAVMSFFWSGRFWLEVEFWIWPAE